MGPLPRGPGDDLPSVGKRGEQVGLVDIDMQPVRGEVEVADDLRPQQGERVCARRSAHAGPQLLGHARAADDVAALEDLDVEPRPRQVRGRDEAVVAGADDDRVEGVPDSRHAVPAYPARVKALPLHGKGEGSSVARTPYPAERARYSRLMAASSTRGAVVITGASTGIGHASALHLSSLGFQVFAGVRRDEDAERLRQANGQHRAGARSTSPTRPRSTPRPTGCARRPAAASPGS